MKILIVDEVHDILLHKLVAANFQLSYQPEISAAAVANTATIYEGLIIRSKTKITEEIIKACRCLKFIGRVGAGLENIDVEYARKCGIVCINSPEGNRDSVGEQAIGMLLMLLNNLKKADEEVRKGIWNREGNRGVELKGKTVGIIGYGNMGSAFAEKLAGFGVNCIAYDKYKTNFGSAFVQEVELKTIFTQSDILSLHVPLTDETKYMVNEKFINKFEKSFILINTARGAVVETSSLVNALKNNWITAAALDVLEYESTTFENLHKENLPPEFEYLCQSEKVVLSPHIAGWTHESNKKLSEIMADKIIEAFHMI